MHIIILLLATLWSGIAVYGQQLIIPRVEQMPNLPSPYQMRDWKQVARGYDSLVFDLNQSGQYLPLVWINEHPLNYPEHSSFGLHTYVGTQYPDNAEAINCLPAVIGASLVGIDKRNQFGYNWVLGCEEFFNRRPAENVYLNNPVSESGDDWWYATMPNIFFYQLYDLYPGTGDFEYQLRSVADQWLKAVLKMGGNTTPWTVPYMNYRGWYLATMQPYAAGITEPEAAGAIAWLLYHAYLVTGEVKYRWGSELALEFLNNLTTNPSYELQLPYGVYIAARMNAELGTTYDIEKMVNWCFDPTGNVREWGVTLGRWGQIDCYGLVGEAMIDGYAFAMNSFQMAAALVPMVRYDDRFARAIGKWMLNLSNAARLFYTDYLPDSNQDGASWAHQYDPHSYLAHEALRQSYYGASPYATGDAVKGGWSRTNYALYGSSHVGYLAAMVDTTDIPGVLRLDLRATDFFQRKAYPSYLIYNPYNEAKSISWDIGSQPVDLYDAITNDFKMRNVSGRITLNIPPDDALLTVLVPTGKPESYFFDKLVVDGVVVDYNAGRSVIDYPPRIKALAADKCTVRGSETVQIYCTATDRERDRIFYAWFEGKKRLPDTLATITWQAPSVDSIFTLYCQVHDGTNPPMSDSLQIKVYSTYNHAPVILELGATARKLNPGDTTTLNCRAWDEDGDRLSFSWTATAGVILGTDSVVNWIAPPSSGFFWVKCSLDDERGGRVCDSLSFQVRNPEMPQIGDPVLYLPFCGTAADFSGMNNHGQAVNVISTSDRHGIAGMAYQFDGTSSFVKVPVNASLNFTAAISVSLWIRPTQLYTTRETYPISHGNWENRWKISITPAQKIRWTVKTTAGIKDLDSKTTVTTSDWYHIVAIYDGTACLLYVNGNLDNQSSFNGTILPTNIDLTIGQVLPGNNQYNFKGLIDDVRLYDYALDRATVTQLYQAQSPLVEHLPAIPPQFSLQPNYPNPFNSTTSIRFQLPEPGTVRLEVYDLLGQRVATLVDTELSTGEYQYVWESEQLSSGVYFICLQQGQRLAIQKCIKLK